MQKNLVFRKFFESFHHKLNEHIESNELISVSEIPSINSNLYEELFSLSYLVLIHELNNYRDNGFLKGKTSEERYLHFEKLIGETEFLEYIEKKYPALIVLMNQKLNHVIESTYRIVQAFYDDHSILEKTFGLPIGRIKDIQIGAGDTHEFGETVAIIIFDGGKLVYKPNSLMNDVMFNELIDHVNPNLSVKLKKVKVISRDKYGWQQFIPHKECHSVLEVRSFYHRLGTYLALFYTLNSSDYHNENIIASGEYPSIIDTETLITTSVDSFDEDSMMHHLLQDNVLRSGLLPVQTEGSYLDMDISGLSGGDIDSSTFEVYDIENIGTDQMVVRKKLLKGKIDKSHIPFIKGKEANVLDYIDYFTDGFEETMHLLMKKKSLLKNWLKDKKFEDSRYRQVLRPTYVYGKVLDSGNYPTYLMDLEQRINLFDRIINNESSKKSVDEALVMTAGNIPSYECFYRSKDLYRGDKLIQKNYFKETPKQVVERKIDSLSEETIRFQLKLLECSILTITEEISVPNQQIKQTKMKCNSIEESYTAIYNNILSYVINLPNKNIKDLFQVRSSGVKYVLGGSNFSIYEGGGMIWAIYCYGLETKNSSIQYTARCLLEKAEINYNIAKYKTRSSCSAFSDTFGAVYLYYNFYKQTGYELYYKRYSNYLNRCREELNNCLEEDYVTGVSGIIHLLSNIYRDHPDEALMEIIHFAIGKLENKLVKEQLQNSSIAHGKSGIAIAFSDIFDLTGKNEYMEKALQLLSKEVEAETLKSKAWCRGLSGVLIAYANVLSKSNLSFNQHNLVENKFHTLFDQYMILPERNSIGLCHGTSGELETINELKSNYNKLLTNNERAFIQKRMIQFRKNIPETNGNNLGVPLGLSLDLFMLGSSGVAYTQLRTKNTAYPSLLMLNIMTATNKEVILNKYFVDNKKMSIKER